MALIVSRDEENDTRKKRMAKIKRGPGVFTYDGSGFDTEYVPTPKLVGRDTPVLDGSGMPVLDGSGRQVFQRPNTPERDIEGKVVLGGVPKVLRHKIEVYKLRGVEFPAGKPVQVNDASLALKLRCLPCFVEGEAAVKAHEPMDEGEATPVAGEDKPKRGPGRPKKTDHTEG